MKKVFLVLFCLLFAIGMAACNNGGASESQSSSSSESSSVETPPEDSSGKENEEYDFNIFAQPFYIVYENLAKVRNQSSLLQEYALMMTGNVMPRYSEQAPSVVGEDGYAIYIGTVDWFNKKYADLEIYENQITDNGYAIIPNRNKTCLAIAARTQEGIEAAVSAYLVKIGCTVEGGNLVPVVVSVDAFYLKTPIIS